MRLSQSHYLKRKDPLLKTVHRGSKIKSSESLKYKKLRKMNYLARIVLKHQSTHGGISCLRI